MKCGQVRGIVCLSFTCMQFFKHFLEEHCLFKWIQYCYKVIEGIQYWRNVVENFNPSCGYHQYQHDCNGNCFRIIFNWWTISIYLLTYKMSTLFIHILCVFWHLLNTDLQCWFNYIVIYQLFGSCSIALKCLI